MRLGKGDVSLRHLSLALLAIVATVALTAPATAQTPKKKGQTIFAEDRKSTMKAMRNIAKAMGEKCTYCHIKEGGKVVYEKDTPHKKVARQMKLIFIDSLVTKSKVEVSFPHHDKTKVIQAHYVAEGDSAGIYLLAQEGEGPKHEGMVALPPEGEVLSCMTCHGGKVHNLIVEEEDKK